MKRSTPAGFFPLRIRDVIALCGGIGVGLAGACTGEISGVGGSEPDDGTGTPGSTPAIGSPERPEGYGQEVNPLAVEFVCDEQQDPSITPLRRLTIDQYENTLRDLFAGAATAGVVDEASDALDQIPVDGEQEDSFDNMDGRISQRHVDGFFNVSDDISRSIVGDSQRLAAIAGDCTNAGAVDAACLRDFVTTFGQRVFRRPLADSEIDRFLELNDSGEAPSEVYRGIVFAMLMAPQFLYHFEIGGSEVDGRAEYLDLTPWEIASRLSYHFWQTMPDATLFQAAADGSIATDDGFTAQVERLFADPRTEATVQRFYADWFHLDVFGGFATTPAFATFEQGTRADTQLYADAVREIEALVDFFTFDTPGGRYSDLLTSDLSFADSPALADLYGVAPWDGSSAPGRLPAGERSGLLTRAAMLISSNHSTNPFKRGAFVRRELLCIPVKPPASLPADALIPPPFAPDTSTRDRFAEKVEPQECAGCHATFMPFGFALEAYDGLGRFRTEETIIDEDGNIVANVPIDMSAILEIDAGSQVPVAGPVEMSQALADSGVADECFSRHYFRYTFRRNESIGDECSLTAILGNLEGPEGLKGAMRDMALDESFRQRVWQ